MKRILLVEDEPGIAEPLTRLLEQDGYAVVWANCLSMARREAGQAPDLIILDWVLPDGQGIDLLREWRASGRSTPVVFLTARHELVDKVLGLEFGADDYVTKPFEPRELLARIKARLRPQTTRPIRSFSHAGIVMDDDAHVVTYRGATIELARMEYALLRLFLSNVGRVFSRDEILNQVWGFEAYPTTRTVDTHVLQLRQKFAQHLLETVRGVGYRMTALAGVDEELTKN